jgi:hypothetical protein
MWTAADESLPDGVINVRRDNVGLDGPDTDADGAAIPVHSGESAFTSHSGESAFTSHSGENSAGEVFSSAPVEATGSSSVATPDQDVAAELGDLVNLAAQSTAIDSREDKDTSRQEVIGTQIVTIDPQLERQTRIVEVAVPPMVRRAVREKERAAAAGAHEEQQGGLLDDFGIDARHFYLRMHRLDRLTSWLLALAFLFSFLPWQRVTGVGWVSGVEGFGSLSAGLALIAFGCIYWRTVRRRLAGALMTLQLLVIAGVGAIPMVWFLTNRDLQLSFGSYGTVLAAAIAVLLSLARLTRLSV